MKTTPTLVTAVLLTITLSVAQGAERTGKRPGFAPTRKVVYKTVDDVSLSLHVFEPEGHQPSDRRPAIVFFFGGGWVGGSPSQFYPHCQYLASRGMFACSAEYRVNKRHKTSPFECVKDGKSAVRWLRAHAGELGIDADKIAAGGGSAGGHVAACTGTIDGLDEEGEDTSVSSRPVAMVLFNPVIDTGPKGYGYSRLKDRYREISPVDHVKQGVPPTIIFHGTGDTTVPVENVQRFRDGMAAAGNECKLDEFEGAAHGFFNFGRDGGAAYDQTVKSMDQFLAAEGLLVGEPTIDPTP